MAIEIFEVRLGMLFSHSGGGGIILEDDDPTIGR
jgi:hypothetical protein